MQVTETAAEGLKREFKVTVAASEIESRVQSRLARLARTVKLPGFRPGKAPLPLLKKQYGRSILGEVLEEAVDEGSKKTIGDNQLRPALRPKIEVTSFDEGKDLEFELKLEVLPEVPQVELGAIALTRLVAEVPPEKAEEAIQNFARSRQKFELPDPPRPAADGDQLTIDFAGTIDGAAFEGGSSQRRAAAARLQGHDPGLRGAADRCSRRRDPRARGDLPGRLRQQGGRRQGRFVHRHRQGGEGAGAGHDRRRLGQGAGPRRRPRRAQGDLRQALHRRVPERQPHPAEAGAARPAGRRLPVRRAAGHGRPRVRGDLEAAPGRDGAHRRRRRRPGQERGRAQGRVSRHRRAARAAGPDPVRHRQQERDQGRERGAAPGRGARGDALHRPGAQGVRVLQEQPGCAGAAPGTVVRGQGLRLHLRAGAGDRAAGLDRGAAARIRTRRPRPPLSPPRPSLRPPPEPQSRPIR